MIEKTTPTTVMTAAASVVRIWRAASAVPLITHDGAASVASVRGPVEQQRAREQRDGPEHLEARHDPQVGPQRLAAPVRAERRGPGNTHDEPLSISCRIDQLPTRLPGSPLPCILPHEPHTRLRAPEQAREELPGHDLAGQGPRSRRRLRRWRFRFGGVVSGVSSRPGSELTELMDLVWREDARVAGGGSLRTYLGTAPGVGKTVAMLAEGRRRAGNGERVVVGWIESHGRPETSRQLGGPGGDHAADGRLPRYHLHRFRCARRRSRPALMWCWWTSLRMRRRTAPGSGGRTSPTCCAPGWTW